MNMLPPLYALEGLADPETGSRWDGIRPFVAVTRSPADSMQFVALKMHRGCSGQQKAHFSVPQTIRTISKPTTASFPFRNISAGLSLVTLSLGFSLIGMLSFIHHPLADESFETTATTSALGGVAGLAAGCIFSVSTVVYWRRLAIAEKSGPFVQVSSSQAELLPLPHDSGLRASPQKSRAIRNRRGHCGRKST